MQREEVRDAVNIYIFIAAAGTLHERPPTCLSRALVSSFTVFLMRFMRSVGVLLERV